MSAVALGRGALQSPRLCKFVGWELVHAASSMVAVLWQLLVANVLTNCFVIHRLHCCLPADVGASSIVNLSCSESPGHDWLPCQSSGRL